MTNGATVQVPVQLLDSILARLDALERQQQLPRLTEELSANYLTLAADGTVGANFTGHVHAQGLDLDEATSSTPPMQNQIRWIDAAGTTREQMFGYVGPFGHVLLLAASPDSVTDASLTLSAHGAGGTPPSSVGAFCQQSGAAADITILDATGASDFLQAANALSELPDSTGAGAASLGGNCPAGSPAQPYTWITATAHDGTSVHIPAWH